MQTNLSRDAQHGSGCISTLIGIIIHCGRNWSSLCGQHSEEGGGFHTHFGAQARLFPITQPCLDSWPAPHFAHFQLSDAIQWPSYGALLRAQAWPRALCFSGNCGLRWTLLLTLRKCIFAAILKGVTCVPRTEQCFQMSRLRASEESMQLCKLFNPLRSEGYFCCIFTFWGIMYSTHLGPLKSPHYEVTHSIRLYENKRFI